MLMPVLVRMKINMSLTLCCMNSFFRRFLRYIPRQALIFYRLINAALIVTFSNDSYFKIELFAICFSLTTLCSKRSITLTFIEHFYQKFIRTNKFLLESHVNIATKRVILLIVEFSQLFFRFSVTFAYFIHFHHTLFGTGTCSKRAGLQLPGNRNSRSFFFFKGRPTKTF